MKATLVISRGSDSGEIYDLPEGREIQIGRSSQNDLPLRDSQVSRYHCQVANRDGEIILSDLGSRNGSCVNGKRVKVMTTLLNGDVVQIGGTRFVIHVEADDSLSDDAPSADDPEGRYAGRLRTMDRDEPAQWVALAQWCDKDGLAARAEECRAKAKELQSSQFPTGNRLKLSEYRARLAEHGLELCPKCRTRGYVDPAHEDCFGTGIDLSGVELPPIPDGESGALEEVQLDDLRYVDMLARLGLLGEFADPRRVFACPAQFRALIVRVPWVKRIWIGFAERVLERLQVPVTPDATEELVAMFAEKMIHDWRRLVATIYKLKAMPTDVIVRLTPRSLDKFGRSAVLSAIVQERFGRHDERPAGHDSREFTAAGAGG